MVLASENRAQPVSSFKEQRRFLAALGLFAALVGFSAFASHRDIQTLLPGLVSDERQLQLRGQDKAFDQQARSRLSGGNNVQGGRSITNSSGSESNSHRHPVPPPPLVPQAENNPYSPYSKEHLHLLFNEHVQKEVRFNNWRLGCNDLQFLVPYLKAISDRTNFGRVRQRRTIVDVGANNGDDAHAILGGFQAIRGMCWRFGQPILLLSIEPSPKVFCELADALQQAQLEDPKYEETHILNIALSNQTGNLVFRDPGNEGGTIIGGDQSPKEKISEEEWTNLGTCQLPAEQVTNQTVDCKRISTVPTYTLDLLFESMIDLGLYNRTSDRIYVLKVDAEQHDDKVVYGAATLLQLQRIDFVLFEISKTQRLLETVEFMFAKGYDCYLIFPHNLIPLHAENWWYPHLNNITGDFWWGNAMCGIGGSHKMEMLWRMYHSDDARMANSYHLLHGDGNNQESLLPIQQESKHVKGRFEPADEVESQAITDLLLEQELGWAHAPPDWIKDLCPQVIEHFDSFPSFKHVPDVNGIPLPVGTTNYFAKSVCTLAVVKQLTASVGASLQLYAGSHLAAVLHGQPIPWDDDIDVLVPFWVVRPLLAKCGDGIQIHPTARLVCHEAYNAIKFYVDFDGMEMRSFPSPRFQYKAPFIDLFAYNITNDRKVFEVSPTGGQQRFQYELEKCFPSQPFYFGGIHVMGPQPSIALNRYSAHKCTMGTFNHRVMFQIGHVTKHLNATNLDVDCQRLSESFPFIYDDETLRNGKASLAIYPAKASTNNVTSQTSISRRLELIQRPPSAGQDLTDQLPGLNEVEVDNTISAQDECGKDGKLKVIEYNAGRAKFWLEAVDLFKEADVVVLNEMDLGMARSDQQHTTRHLAHMLRMNYAWGLEFLELTNGDEEESSRTVGLDNFHGLHGNAILSRCKIVDPTIFRDAVGPYFDNKKNWANAGGFERRLGGRMGLYARIKVAGDKMLVVGSTHKLTSHAEEIKEYIGSSKAISAGDQGKELCSQIGLDIIGSSSQKSWPASCGTFGRVRGDNVCSSLTLAEPEEAAKPCLEKFGIQAQLSDHSLLVHNFQL